MQAEKEIPIKNLLIQDPLITKFLTNQKRFLCLNHFLTYFNIGVYFPLVQARYSGGAAREYIRCNRRLVSPHHPANLEPIRPADHQTVRLRPQ